MGIPVTLPEFAAAMLGTWPEIKGGLLSTVPTGAMEDCVTIEEAELDLAGDAGRGVTNAAAGGDGAVSALTESRCRCCVPLGKGDGGANADVGVGIGVFCDDRAAGPAPACLGGPISPVYTCPSSPGRKDNVEQNPSDDEISSVNPSLDLSSGLAQPNGHTQGNNEHTRSNQ